MIHPNPTPNDAAQPEAEETTAPIFPPGYLLAIAGAGFLLALFMAFTRRELPIEFWGGIGVGVLCLIAWAVMVPEQLMNVLRGRALSYGGTAALSVVIFVVMLTLVYIVIRQQGWRRDFSDTQFFTLTAEARTVVETLAADPTTPALRIIGFYGTAQGGVRDRAQVLLDDVVQAGGGKLSYEFIDPDREPLITQGYDARAGQLFIVPLDEAGQPIQSEAEELPSLDQQQLIDGLVAASASGDFRAFFLALQDGIDFADSGPSGGAILKTELEERFKWQTPAVSLVDLANDRAELKLGDAAANGDVLVIGGGQTPLRDEDLERIKTYLDNGGGLVLFGEPNFTAGPSLATAPNLAEYLYTQFGVRFGAGIVFDLEHSFQSPLQPVSVGFNASQFITRDFDAERDALVLSTPLWIEQNPEVPANVTVTVLSTTFESAYVKTGLDFSQQLSEANIARAEGDQSGALPVAVAVENSVTGARLVLVGSAAPLFNLYEQLAISGAVNSDLALNSILWAANYDVFRNIPPLEIVTPQPIPLLVADNNLWIVNFVALILLPFGILGVGIFIWWSRREREAI